MIIGNKLLILFLLLASLIFFTSCMPLKQSSKYQFSEGFYKIRGEKPYRKVYVLTGSDTVKVYKSPGLRGRIADSVKGISFLFPAQKPGNFHTLHFNHNTFDADVLTVLFKYRPRVSEFPPQLNATFNGAVYLGYRTDNYKLSYTSSPLGVYKRNITHYGYSAGLFTGIGTARIDEYVTRGRLDIQYDGLVNLTGFAVIIAVDKLTAGLTLGEDHLLDKNKKLFINNGKPWIGLSLGLNLN